MKKICTLLALALMVSPLSVLAQTNEPSVTPKPRPRLIKSTDSDAVYYLDSDLKRHAFPNEKIFSSWYNDFSQVELVLPQQLAEYQLSKNILYRPGSVLFKTPSVNEVYAVGPWGKIYNIESEQVASALYGPNWAMKVHDLDVSFFLDYSITDVIRFNEENLAHYPTGSLVRHFDTTYVVDYSKNSGRLLRPISGKAWFENNLNSLPVHEFDLVENSNIIDFGLPVYSYEARLGCTYCSAEQYERADFEVSEFDSADSKISFIAPNNWIDINLSEIQSAQDIQPMLLDLRSENDETIFQVFRYDLGTFADVEEFYQARLSIGDEMLYEGYSLAYPDAWDFVQLFETDGVNVVFWSQLRQYGEYIYVFDFASDTEKFEKHINVLDQIFDSISYTESLEE